MGFARARQAISFRRKRGNEGPDEQMPGVAGEKGVVPFLHPQINKYVSFVVADPQEKLF